MAPAPTRPAGPRRTPHGALWAVIASALLLLAGCTSGTVPGLAAGSTDGTSVPGPGATPDRPNIVFVLTDDLSSNLLPYMPHVLALQHRGMTFTNYTVTDSLCCPSRASIFTGKFPHDTKVVSNVAPNGGFERFRTVGDEKQTFATALTAAGYRTALYGKYLNGYQPRTLTNDPISAAYVPRGWTAWGGVDGRGYDEFDYSMGVDIGHDAQVQTFGASPDDYLTNVIQRMGTAFADRSMADNYPFLLELATFAPHRPAVPAPADAGTFTGLTAPRPPSFGRLPTDPPPWMRPFGRLTKVVQRRINVGFARRVESVQAVDRMVGDLQRLLQQRHELRNTVFIFSSDNGYHMGEHDLWPGKQTAFDTDVRVPLIVAGPHIPHDSVNRAVVENIDLAPTFDQLAGAPVPASVDGRSIVPLLHGQSPPWRTVALVEHTQATPNPNDPDAQILQQGNPPSYDAIRTPAYTFVRYRRSGALEYYDLRRDPNELHNLARSLPRARIAQLEGILAGLKQCHGTVACWRAARPTR